MGNFGEEDKNITELGRRKVQAHHGKIRKELRHEGLPGRTPWISSPYNSSCLSTRRSH